MVTSPEQLRDRATALRALASSADRLADDTDEVRRRAGPETWKGPAADAFRWRLATHARSLDLVAEHLRAVARRLDAIADDLLAG